MAFPLTGTSNPTARVDDSPREDYAVPEDHGKKRLDARF